MSLGDSDGDNLYKEIYDLNKRVAELVIQSNGWQKAADTSRDQRDARQRMLTESQAQTQEYIQDLAWLIEQKRVTLSDVIKQDDRTTNKQVREAIREARTSEL